MVGLKPPNTAVSVGIKHILHVHRYEAPATRPYPDKLKHASCDPQPVIETYK